jgi:hypothetical protein
VKKPRWQQRGFLLFAHVHVKAAFAAAPSAQFSQPQMQMQR